MHHPHDDLEPHLARLAANDTRRGFIERLAKTSAVPLILPLLFSKSKVAVAYS